MCPLPSFKNMLYVLYYDPLSNWDQIDGLLLGQGSGIIEFPVAELPISTWAEGAGMCISD